MEKLSQILKIYEFIEIFIFTNSEFWEFHFSSFSMFLNFKWILSFFFFEKRQTRIQNFRIFQSFSEIILILLVWILVFLKPCNFLISMSFSSKKIEFFLCPSNSLFVECNFRSSSSFFSILSSSFFVSDLKLKIIYFVKSFFALLNSKFWILKLQNSEILELWNFKTNSETLKLSTSKLKFQFWVSGFIAEQLFENWGGRS